MKTRTIASLIIVAALLFQVSTLNIVTAQGPNPPYLSEMPTVDRVMRAMQAADPRDTALRQMGAFYELKEIINALSGPREFRGLLPDEARIMQVYNVAQYNVAQAADKIYPGQAGTTYKFSEQNPYHYSRWDRRFGVEGIAIFKLFFSPALQAEFQKIVNGDNERRQAKNDTYKGPPVTAAQQTGAITPGSKAELRRCIESGRSQRTCFTEVMGNGMEQIYGMSTKMPSTPGPRLTGDYSGPGGLRLIFQPEKVTAVCQGVPFQLLYAVELTDTQANVRIGTSSGGFVLGLKLDGKLSGHGPVKIDGPVPSGTRTEQTSGMTAQKGTRERELTPLEAQNYPGAKQNGQTYSTTEETTEMVYGPTGSRNVTTYENRTAECTLGLMTPTGPTPNAPDLENPLAVITTLFSGASVLANGGSTKDALADMLTLDKPIAPGLRMRGRFAGEHGFSITFHPESATLACGDAERALEYSIQRTANQTLLKFKDNSNPVTLQLKPDGSLFGEGTAQVNGRVIVGTTEDPNNPFIYSPKIGRCEMGRLVPNGPSTSTGPVATTPPSAPATAPAAGSKAVFSIASGLATQPGVGNPLGGTTFLVLKESLETILVRAGVVQPGSSTSAITTWLHACQSRKPICQQATEQLRAYVVVNAKFDANGAVTFPNADAGTYYVFASSLDNRVPLFWNVRVDLKPGTNSVTLDQRNATSIDR
jgi:hypothetical protein